MRRRTPTSTLFPYTTLFRSSRKILLTVKKQLPSKPSKKASAHLNSKGHFGTGFLLTLQLRASQTKNESTRIPALRLPKLPRPGRKREPSQPQNRQITGRKQPNGLDTDHLKENPISSQQ